MLKGKINNFDNYEIYENGLVFNLKTQEWIPGTINHSGYHCVNILNNQNKRCVHRVHRLVYESIKKESLKGFVIHHKNNIKLDNNLNNLQKMTRKEHTKLHGKERIGKSKKTSKIGGKIPNDFWDTTTDIWKKIEGTNNFWCSDKGEIINTKTKNYILGGETKDGYFKCYLVENNITKINNYKHIIIYKAFNDDYDNKLIIHHKDFNSSNNNKDNLILITQKEHIKLQKEKYKIKPEEINKWIKEYINGKSFKDISLKYNKERKTISINIKEHLGEVDFLKLKEEKSLKIKINNQKKLKKNKINTIIKKMIFTNKQIKVEDEIKLKQQNKEKEISKWVEEFRNGMSLLQISKKYKKGRKTIPRNILKIITKKEYDLIIKQQKELRDTQQRKNNY